jgi:N4-gp56 family major capsid protein
MSNEYGDISGQQAARFEKTALNHAEDCIVLGKGSKQFTQPTSATDTMKWRRVIPYAAATTALTEGVAPAGTDFRYEEVSATLLQYGGFTPLTDVLVDMHEAPILKDINIQNAECAAKTKEALMWGTLGAATNVIYAGGVNALNAVVAPLTEAEQKLAVRTLKRNKAKKFTSIVTGGVKVGTKPVEAAFIAFTHTDCDDNVRAMEGFTPVAKYGTMQTISPYEIGSVGEVRYISSPDLDSAINAGGTAGTNISGNDTAADVYTTIICGMEAYGQVQLAGKGSFTPIIRMVGTPSAGDPLGQTGSVGWKIYSDEVILDQRWLVAVKHTVDETPA